MKITITAVFFMFCFASGMMAQEPFAPIAVMSKDAPLAPKAADVPAKTEVGFPTYPGAVIISIGKPGMIKGKETLPFINLVTTDAPKDVIDFYKSKLPAGDGWKWHGMVEMFLQGDNPMAAIGGNVPFVSISGEAQGSIDTKYLTDEALKTGIKTRIQIVYEPLATE